ncbi:Protein STR-52 [Corchorus capsularis]|uniref:Protein STR-52 n=1 Tax=Corchorus capsularis TaxID=210143 RepID=A0A1R3GNZ2_COCAP|nr:Protein STR-52 [Corchorus capsularis]
MSSIIRIYAVYQQIMVSIRMQCVFLFSAKHNFLGERKKEENPNKRKLTRNAKPLYCIFTFMPHRNFRWKVEITTSAR